MGALRIKARLFTQSLFSAILWTGGRAKTMRRDWQRGETIPIWAEIRLANTGALYDPTGGVFVTLTNPNRTVVLDGVAMTRDSLGLFVFNWNSPANSLTGWYKTRVRAQDGTGMSARIVIESGAFQLME